MNTIIFFTIVAGISFLVFLVSSIRMVIFLQSQKVKINWFLIRILIFKYVNQYKNFMLNETGNVGSLYHVWSVSLFIMIVSAAAAIIAKLSV